MSKTKKNKKCDMENLELFLSNISLRETETNLNEKVKSLKMSLNAVQQKIETNVKFQTDLFFIVLGKSSCMWQHKKCDSRVDWQQQFWTFG